jgi:hypothetical protein
MQPRACAYVSVICLVLAGLCGSAAAGPINLSTNEQQANEPQPLGAPGAAPAPFVPPSCTGFDTVCSGATASLKPPPAFAFDYGLTAEAGVAGSNHGFGTSIGVGAWIKPVGTDLTLSVSIAHQQWNPSKDWHY